MKRIAYKTYTRCAVSILSTILLLTISAKTAYQHLFSVHHYTTSIDSRIALEIQNTIIKKIDIFFASLNQSTKKTADLISLSHALHAQFSCIESIELQRTPNSYAHIDIHAHTPYLHFENNHNEHYVATHSGLILPRAAFMHNVTEGLRTIVIADNTYTNQLPTACMQFMHALPSTLLQEYTFHWHGQNYIELNKKNNPTFSLLLSQSSTPNDTLMNYCNALYEHLDEQGAFVEKKKKHWIADVRFKDQIILFTRKGGI